MREQLFKAYIINGEFYIVWCFDGGYGYPCYI